MRHSSKSPSAPSSSGALALHISANSFSLVNLNIPVMSFIAYFSIDIKAQLRLPSFACNDLVLSITLAVKHKDPQIDFQFVDGPLSEDSGY